MFSLVYVPYITAGSSGGINYVLPNFDTYKYLRILIRTEMVGGGVGRMTRVIKVGEC